MRRKKVKFRSSKIRKRKRRILVIKISLYVILAAGLIYSLSFLSSTQILTIDRVEIIGNQVVEESSIRNLVESELESKILGLFPRKNIFLYPKKLIKNKLSNQFERLASVNLDLKGFKVLEIKVEERKAVAVWCEGFSPEKPDIKDEPAEELLEDEYVDQEKITGECYLVDSSGLIFAPHSTSIPLSLIRYEGEKLESRTGSYFWTNRDAKMVSEFVSSLKSLKVNVLKIVKEPEKKVVIVIDTDTNLFLNLENDWPKAFENMVTLISEPEFAEYEGKNILSPFAYIDLRFNNKLLYRLK
jgi:hypothetical protein